MAPSRLGIDHVVHVVGDLDAARRRFESFGFTTTPRALHPFGTGNHLIQLDRSYIELISVVDPAKIVPPGEDGFSISAFIEDYHGKRQGTALLALSTDDALREHEEWRARGLRTVGPYHFSRKAKLPDGSEGTVAFTLVIVVDDRFPDAVFFVNQHHARELVWQRVYQSHANGAQAIGAVSMVADEPGLYESFFSRLYGGGAVRTDDGRLWVEMAHGRLDVLTPAESARRFPSAAGSDDFAGPRFVATSVAVSDLSAVKAALRASGVPFAGSGGAVQLGPEQALGMVLELVQAGESGGARHRASMPTEPGYGIPDHALGRGDPVGLEASGRLPPVRAPGPDCRRRCRAARRGNTSGISAPRSPGQP